MGIPLVATDDLRRFLRVDEEVEGVGAGGAGVLEGDLREAGRGRFEATVLVVGAGVGRETGLGTAEGGATWTGTWWAA